MPQPMRTIIESFNCPQCEGAIPSSLTSHDRQFDRLPFRRSTWVCCPHCGAQHEQSFIGQPDGSWLAEGGPARVSRRLTAEQRHALDAAIGAVDVDWCDRVLAI